MESVHYNARLQRLMVVLREGTPETELLALSPDIAAMLAASTDGSIKGISVTMAAGEQLRLVTVRSKELAQAGCCKHMLTREYPWHRCQCRFLLDKHTGSRPLEGNRDGWISHAWSTAVRQACQKC